MKRLLLCGAAALALVACGGEKKDATSTAGGATVAATSEAATPELGAWGVDTQDIDAATKPGDDFYRYVNGRWLDTFKIPDEYSSYGSFTVLLERSEERVKAIIEDAAKANASSGSNEKKIGDFFNAYFDTEAINSKALEPLAADFAAIDALATHEDVARALSDVRMAVTTPIGAFVDVDAKQPDRYIVYVTQAGLGMPNRDYYLDAKFADKQAKYKSYVAQMLTLAGVVGGEAKATAIYDLERRMAEVHWAPAKRRERDLTYNFKTLDDLRAFAPGAPWDAMLEGAGLTGQTMFVIREYDAIQNLVKILMETPVEAWKDYMKFHLARGYADVLPAAIDEATFAFFGAELTGAVKQKERWKRGVAAVNGAMGEAVGNIYVERHFPPESKAAMDTLVGNLRVALDARLDTLPWM
ncbi:MAG: M13 family metallopeptidase N-terminal domain-containing protein, partial [Parvularculaceae bacterium]